MDWDQYDVPPSAWAVFCEFYECWRSLKIFPNTLPSKSKLCPSTLGALTRRFALIERTPANIFRFRLVADGLQPTKGTDLSGMDIPSLFPPALAEQIQLGFERASAQITGAYHDFTITLASGHSFEGDALYLPFSKDGRSASPDFYGVVFAPASPADEFLYAASRPVRFQMGDVVYLDMGQGQPDPAYAMLSAYSEERMLRAPRLVHHG